jgi:nicotinate-nucleotide adenylyltransferase
MTVGLLGGAFDPPHVGHVALAREAVRRFGLDRLIVLVVAAPGHKPVDTDVEHRLELARLAFAEVERAEVAVDPNGFTDETVRDPRFEGALFVIGADEFVHFLAWRDPEAVLARVRLAVATRPGYSPERLDGVLAELAHPERVELFEIPAVDASSTDIRARVARGEPIDGLVPPAVARRIVELGLYHDGG